MINCSKGRPPDHEAAESPSQIADRPETPVSKRKKPPSPRKCRDFIRRQAADAMPEIVEVFVEKAKGGSVPHFTSLTRVGGFDQRPSSSELPKRRGKSLGRQLLDEVERYEKQQAAELTAANSQVDNGKPQEKA